MSYLQGYDDEMGMVLEHVRNERHRQEELRRAGRFKETCASATMDEGVKLAVLLEEVGEVARALLEKGDAANDKHGVELRKELVQVAAVCVAWVEAIDAKATP